MGEEANSLSQICENSLTTLNAEVDPEKLPPRTISHTTRRTRFRPGNVPLSPYILIDGKKLRSSLALCKKKLPRRVNFPTNDSLLVTGYLEPANPWKLAENVNLEDLIVAYKESCVRHNTESLETVISQLQSLDTSRIRNEELNLKGQKLDVNQAETLEEIFKRVQFNRIDLEATSLDDESSVILFDMIEYYESAKQVNISSNQGIEIRGWQACANMIRKTSCLEHLEAKDIILSEQYMNILSRALPLVCHLHVLKLENCGLSGRSIVTLVAALKMNTGIRELYLADNNLNFYDAIQLGSLLRLNNHIQLLDVSNNIIQDDGVRDMLEGLINQISEDKSGKGLNILVLWNNQLTKESSPYFARILTLCKTLETLNIGKNMLTDELLFAIKDALKKNHILLQLGVQSTDLTCAGIVTLSEIIEINQVLQRIDLRNNDIGIDGIRALRSAMKNNKSITKIDLDDEPNSKIVDRAETLHQYTQFLAEIRSSCTKNLENCTFEDATEGFQSSFHSRFCSTVSRKISLTCQTLPCSLSSMITMEKDDSGRPKRTNGGRLRSPIPSPTSSPVVSPVPSPSRSRFVVSRVPETSRELSVPSSVVFSPVKSSSSVASASGPSRFRVSVVESANASPSKPTIVTTNVQIVRDESNDNFVAESKTSTDQNATSSNAACENVEETMNASVNTEEKTNGIDEDAKRDPYVQKSSSNLGKLLSLFQNSSCFFTDSIAITQMKSKNTLQSSINSMMMLGDKFHYYIKDKKDKIYNSESETSFKNKFFNRSQIPGLQSLAYMVPSFRFESNLNDKDCSKEADSKTEYNPTDTKKEEHTDHANESKCLNVRVGKQKINIPSVNSLVPEDIESKYRVGITVNRNITLTTNCMASNLFDSCYEILSGRLLRHVLDNKIIVPVPKLLGIPEHVDSILIEEDEGKETSTNSINFTSDSDSLSDSIMYGLSNYKDKDGVHSLAIGYSNEGTAVANSSHLNVNNLACFICDDKVVCNISDRLPTRSNMLKGNFETNDVIGTCSFNSNKDERVLIDVNLSSNKVGEINALRVSRSTFNDANRDSSNGSNRRLCTLILDKDILRVPVIQRMIQTFIRNRIAPNNFTADSEGANVVSERNVYPCTGDLDRSILKDLMRCISNTSIDRSLVPSYSLARISESSCESNQIGNHSSANDDKEEGMHFHNETKLEEYDESECSSTCAKVNSIVRSKKDVPCLMIGDTKRNSDFESTATECLKCTNSDDTETPHKYFNAIKCTVAATMCSTVTVSTGSDKKIKIISDQNTSIAEPSSIIHASTK